LTVNGDIVRGAKRMELPDSAAWLWVGIAVFAAIVEVVTPSFGWIFASGAALCSALAAALGAPLALQVLLFSVVLVASLVVLRPRLLKKLGATGVPTRTAALVGKVGEVSVAIDPVAGQGRVVVAGEDWAARSDHALSQGTRVRVTGADGIQLEVEVLGPGA
jgi:membrane protein implicated in regulation of membrane protease activity